MLPQFLRLPWLLAGIAYSNAIEAAFTTWADPSIWDEKKKCDDPPKPFPTPNPGRWDPLVVDLNGDGVKLTPLTNSKVNFDFGADGFAEQTVMGGSCGLSIVLKGPLRQAFLLERFARPRTQN